MNPSRARHCYKAILIVGVHLLVIELRTIPAPGAPVAFTEEHGRTFDAFS